MKKIILLICILAMAVPLWAGTPHYNWIYIPKYPDAESANYPIYMDNFFNDVDEDLWNVNSTKLTADTLPPATPACNVPTTGVEINSDGSAYTWIQATWGAVADTDLREYEIRVKKGSETSYQYLYTNNLGAMFRPAVAGATYYLDVRAIDKQGNVGSYCTQVSVVAAQDTSAPAIPTGLTLSTNLAQDNNGVTYVWVQSDWTANAEKDVTSYKLRIKEGVGGSYYYASTTTNTLRFVGLKQGVTYYVGIEAIDASGNESGYTTDSSTTSASDATPPATPTTLTAQPGFNVVWLTWTKPSENDFDAVEVWRSSANNSSTATKVGESPGVSYADEGIGNNQTFYYWIRNRDWSNNTSTLYPSQYAGVGATTARIDTADIVDAAITAAKTSIAAINPTDGNLNANVVGSNQIQADAVTGLKILNGAVSNAKIATGAIDNTKFVTGLFPIVKVSTLPQDDWCPACNYPEGSVVYFTTDDKLYRSTGYGWTTAIPTSDLTGQITSTQITDQAISTPKLAANAVTANELAANSVQSGHIVAGTIQASDIATNILTANEIAADAITSSELLAGSVTTDKVAAGAITANKITSLNFVVSAGTFASQSPVGGSVSWSGVKVVYNGTEYTITDGNTSNKYVYWQSAAPTVFATSATKPSMGSTDFTVLLNNAGTYLLVWNSTQIDGGTIRTGTITASEIAANTITANEINTGAITADELLAGSVTAGKLDTVNAVITGTAQIENGIITNAKVADLSATKINAGSLQSTNWSGTAGSQLNISDGTFYMGGSTNPKLSWNGSALTVKGNISVESGQTFSCTGSCVDSSEVNFNYAGSLSHGGNSMNTDSVGTQAASAVNTGVSRATTGLNTSGQITKLVDTTNLPAISSGASRVVIGNDGIEMFDGSPVPNKRVDINTDGTFRFGSPSGDNLYWNNSTLVLTGRATIATNADSATNATNASYSTSAGSATTATTASTSNDLNCTDCIAGSEVQFNYAGSSSEGGNANNSNDLSCTDCVADTELNNIIDLGNGGVTVRSSAAANKVQISSGGLYGYNTSGAQTFGVNASNGNAYFGPAGNQIAWDGSTLTVPAAKVTGTLSAATIDTGNLTGTTITGKTIQTAASPNPRIELSQNTKEARWYSDATTVLSSIGVESGADWAFYKLNHTPSNTPANYHGIFSNIDATSRTASNNLTIGVTGGVAATPVNTTGYGGYFYSVTGAGTKIALYAVGTDADLMLTSTKYKGASIQENSVYRKIGYGVFGSVTGTTGAIKRGVGFTSARNSTGVYTVTFSSAFASVPIVIVGSESNSGVYAITADSVTASSFMVRNSGPVDRDFNFFAIAN